MRTSVGYNVFYLPQSTSSGGYGSSVQCQPGTGENGDGAKYWFGQCDLAFLKPGYPSRNHFRLSLRWIIYFLFLKLIEERAMNTNHALLVYRPFP
jgi:hypothetical protein